jgi:hypothetical protein
MREHNSDALVGETFVFDTFTLYDIVGLLSSFEEFARKGDTEAVEELLEYVNPYLSANGLANIAAAFGGHLRRGLKAAR